MPAGEVVNIMQYYLLSNCSDWLAGGTYFSIPLRWGSFTWFGSLSSDWGSLHATTYDDILDNSVLFYFEATVCGRPFPV